LRGFDARQPSREPQVSRGGVLLEARSQKLEARMGVPFFWLLASGFWLLGFHPFPVFLFSSSRSFQ
jgi:hypothetical protein